MEIISSHIWQRVRGFCNKYIIQIVLSLFVFVAVFNLIGHVPNFDEVNAWNIASNFKMFEIFEITKYEGHPFLWYWILRPFAKYNLFFPYIMQFLNLLFITIALITMWRFSHFNKFIKICITFSSPIMIYTVYARDYSIGIMILFLLCAFYKNRLERTLLYSTLVLLLANTNPIFMIGALIFGSIFLYDVVCEYLKDKMFKKNLIIVVLFFVFEAVLAFYQFHGANDLIYQAKETCYDRLVSFVNHIRGEKIFYISYFLTFISSFAVIKSWRIRLFLFGTFASLVGIFIFVYNAHYWHHLILWIYLICAWWIYLASYMIKFDKFNKFKYVLGVLFIISCFSFRVDYWGGIYENFLNSRNSNIPLFENSIVFMYPTDTPLNGIIPKFKGKYNVNFYDMRGNSYNSKKLYLEQWKSNDVEFSMIEKNIKQGFWQGQFKAKTVSQGLGVGHAYVIISSFHPSQWAYDRFKKEFHSQKHNLKIKHLDHYSVFDIYEIRIR